MDSKNDRSNSRRACDGCRIRKVKCSGSSPCTQCGHLGLRCTFDKPTQGRKPRIRNRLIRELRQKHGSSTSLTTNDGDDDANGETAHPINNNNAKPASSSIKSPANNDFDHFPSSHKQSPLEPNYTQAFFTALIPDFEELVFPVQPVSSAAELRAAIANMHDSLGDAALVYAFAAVTINQNPASWAPSPHRCAQRVVHLLRLCFRALRQAQANSDSEVLSELPFTAKRVVTCVFLGTTLMAFNRLDRAFTVLREGIALFQSITYGATLRGNAAAGRWTGEERARYQRLYWLMYIHERFLSLSAGVPCILPEIDMSSLHGAVENLEPRVQLGFCSLVALFRLVDDAFLAHWMLQRDSTPTASMMMPAAAKELTVEWIQHKQTQLDQDEERAAQDEEELRRSGKGLLTEFQRVDLSITRLWLRTLVWQLALSHGLLTSVVAPSSQRNHDGLLLHFPARRLSRQLGSLVSHLETVDSVSAHGCGILQKLFEITSSAADVLSLPAPTPSLQGSPSASRHSEDGAWGYDQDSVGDLVLSISFLLGLNSVDAYQRQYLKAKLRLLQERYPDVDFSGVGTADVEWGSRAELASPVDVYK